MMEVHLYDMCLERISDLHKESRQYTLIKTLRPSPRARLAASLLKLAEWLEPKGKENLAKSQ